MDVYTKKEQKEKEIDRIQDFMTELTNIQCDIVFCFLGNKSYRFVMNCFDMIIDILESALIKKKKELNELKEGDK